MAGCKLRAWPALLLGLSLVQQALPVLGAEVSPGFASIRGHRPIRTFVGASQALTIRQRWDNSCGSAALATVLTHHYGDTTSEAVIITSILRIADPIKIKTRGGFSLLDLKRFVASRGYEGKGYTGLSLKEMVELDVPAIVPVRTRGFDHFVVFRGIRANRVVLSDPAFGTVTMKVDRFLSIWKEGIGFFIFRRDSSQPAEGLRPRQEELLIPNGGAIRRASTMSITPLTRRRP